MPSVPRKNRGVYVELPPELIDQLREYAEGRAESFRDVVERACRREMAYPPPLPTSAPLPDAAPKKPRKKPKE